MEARGIAAASPRARNQLRLVANKQSVGINEGLLNSVKMLQMREMGSKPDRCFSLISDGREKFRNIFLQEEYDTQYPTGLSATMVPFLERQTKVIEIVSAHGVVFALLESGICAAFSRDKNQRICFLNLSRDEVIRTIFYNKYNDSIITVSVFGSENFSSLKCRTTRIQYIQRGQPDAGFLLFESESIKWPSYVEFNDLNAKLLTYSAQDRIYKVFELRNYNILYSISGEDVQDIKMRDRTVAVWNSGGDLVTSYEDHLIWHPDSKSNIICLTNQNLIISYCKVHSNDRQEAQKAGSVNISNILTGKCLAKINAGNTHLLKECECSGRRCNASKAIRATEITSTVQEALENVTALFYDEDRNELYTGSKNGLLHVWSN
ncbi:UDP-N-acetylglucosamine--N-acetylmuramyl-pyrophosphoryl-undecaprenol N-acetylglucosamine transferase like [Heracleum sosnowskyi]|uniref:UDP-N-acetylglucosamine--N-acetylmuramyl-pyrophosphoryl-undecaprenol N-acetylglucosamine transferase like n=1 Tax=Heracleum sosnowskyi TaxID=360622 RepID=A0AAD8J9N3_9APIA|nr:UDP-N-acetylglucosamine--N-acetylmuramyl-pyrophosphoryl-undecaprenol N-acetylglucosamine transferase like [Heracleum sosnowskyi]